jgi:hypothetical protein
VLESRPGVIWMPASVAEEISLGLPRAVETRLRRLKTPEKIQSFINRIPWNYEEWGETSRSVEGVFEHHVAHCIEAAFVAAAAMALTGHPPLLMDMGAAQGDVDHVVALFRRRGLWGAISKSNSPLLRYRDPIHRSLRELAISFFPQYVKGRRKTLRTYSVPIDLRKHDAGLWATREGEVCAEMVDILTLARHFPLVPVEIESNLRPIDAIEERGSLLYEYE